MKERKDMPKKDLFLSRPVIKQLLPFGSFSVQLEGLRSVSALLSVMTLVLNPCIMALVIPLDVKGIRKGTCLV